MTGRVVYVSVHRTRFQRPFRCAKCDREMRVGHAVDVRLSCGALASFAKLCATCADRPAIVGSAVDVPGVHFHDVERFSALDGSPLGEPTVVAVTEQRARQLAENRARGRVAITVNVDRDTDARPTVVRASLAIVDENDPRVRSLVFERCPNLAGDDLDRSADA